MATLRETNMAGPLDQFIKKLGDKNAGWVNRRDAAQGLGAIAARAVQVLKTFEKDPDTDVRMTVSHALGVARAGLEGIAPAAGTGYTMDDFSREISKPPSRVVEKDGKGLSVVVTLPSNNTQRILIQSHEGVSRQKLIRVFTRCGKPRDGSYDWALKTNMNTAQCALALADEEGEEMLLLINHFLADEVTPSEIKSAVKEIAFYGDWIEQKMTGQDQH
jgi:hypothetical protein